MAFESLSEYLDQIEDLLSQGNSPRAVARALNIPSKYQTIARYKKAVFDMPGAARVAWQEEKQKTTSDRLDEGVARIVDSLELLNLAKLRAYQLMERDIGGEYQTSKGESRNLSLGSASIFWQTGQKMACETIRMEQEISGDDPETRKADALGSLSESEIDERLAGLMDVLKEGED